MMMDCITTTPQVSFNDALPLKKVRVYFSMFSRGFVDISFIEEHGQKSFLAEF
jgi:hypothetical protein